MRKLIWLSAAATVLAVAGLAIAGVNLNFGGHLKGANEIPSHDTNAQGQAIFHLSDDGTQLEYKLNVANIDNVVAAHVHMADVAHNGQIVAFLYGPAAPGGGRIEGTLAEGTITAANLIGPLAGHPLSDLVTAINTGNAYVNVHTNDGVDGVNTGPGDFPGGEIRAQIQ